MPFVLTRALKLQHAMTAHRLDVDAVEQPVQLLDAQLDDGLACLRPDEPFGFQSLAHQPSNLMRSARRVRNTETARANGSRPRPCSTSALRPLMCSLKSIGSRCTRTARSGFSWNMAVPPKLKSTAASWRRPSHCSATQARHRYAAARAVLRARPRHAS
jgi:hypothetical protein